MKKQTSEDTARPVSLSAKSKVPFQISLNGFYPSDADDMVNKFENQRTSDDNTKTNVWLSKNFIHQVYLLLVKENADGIRIYFARDTDDDGNNIIIVSTRVGAKNSNIPSGTDHIDYFEHNAPFLRTVQTDGSIIVDHGPVGNGALLYNSASPCNGNNCSLVPGHDLDCETGYAWVQNYSLSVNDKTNTTSEWFELKVLELFDKELQKSKAPGDPDGLRIYFAKSTKNPQRLKFVIVTTRPVGTTHEDYYYCFPWPVPLGDNGEQCPNNCNGTTWPQ